LAVVCARVIEFERKEIAMLDDRFVLVGSIAAVLVACSGAPDAPTATRNEAPLVSDEVRPEATAQCDDSDAYACLCKETYALCQHRCMGLRPPILTSCLNGCAREYDVCLGA
jgi:hypothetical protein